MKGPIWSIFRKEILELIRDKRTLFLLILMPFFLYPVLFYVMGSVGASQAEKLDAEIVQVWVNPQAENLAVVEKLKANEELEVRIKDFNKAMLDSTDEIIGLKIEADKIADSIYNYEATIYANQTSDLVSNKKRDIRKLLDEENKILLKSRLKANDLDKDFATPLEVREVELAEVSDLTGYAIGKFIPMMILLFIFLGCIYIAIDITAGEKERKTIQTLYTAPLRTRDIVLGKFFAVLLVAIVSGLLNLLSLLFAVYIQTKLLGVDGELMQAFQLELGPIQISLLALMIILAAIFIAALTLAFVLIANTYKEAQSYVTPLMMIILLPGIVTSLPGIEFNAQTALIPMLNVTLAMGELFKGDFNLKLILLVVLFQIIYAAIALFLASKIFGNENVITGEKFDWKQLLSPLRKV